jgi:hypothetical protein
MKTYPSKTDTHTLTLRRNFIKTLGGITAGLAALPSITQGQSAPTARPTGAKYMGDFAASKLEKIKCAFIGGGARGSGHASQIAVIEGTDIVGICDPVAGRVERSANNVKAKGHNPKLYSGGEHAWRKMLEETRPDAVFNPHFPALRSQPPALTTAFTGKAIS